MPAKKGNKYALGNSGGRPTKFTLEILEMAKTYIEKCEDKTESFKLKVSLPTLEGLARLLNVSRDTIYAYGKANKEFSDILEDVRAEQAKRLIDNGLSGVYNPTIVKLILSSKHGFVEETKSDVTSGGEKLQGVIILPQKNENTVATSAETGNSTGQ